MSAKGSRPGLPCRRHRLALEDLEKKAYKRRYNDIAHDQKCDDSKSFVWKDPQVEVEN